MGNSSWREKDGVIYFSVESDGTTGEDWIKRLESNGYNVGYDAKQVLRSPDFIPTKGVMTEVAVLLPRIFENKDRFTSNIRAYADAFRTHDKCKLLKPNAELDCYMREKFTDEEVASMGLKWIVTMHEPIKNSIGIPHLLDMGCYSNGCWIRACHDAPGVGWGLGSGFAFILS